MSIANSLCKISDSLFGKHFSDKLKMAANVLLHEWRMYQIDKDWVEEFKNTTDEEIRIVFADLDAESLDHILRYVAIKRNFMIPDKDPSYYFYNYSKFYRPGEVRQIGRTEAAFRRETRKYRNSLPIPLGSYESVLAHHGLKDCPAAVKDYLRDGVFLDVGACYGDSALVFLKHYSPRKVICFEPSAPNLEIFWKNMQLNGIDPSLYEIVQLGLGKEVASLTYCESQGGGNSLLNRQDGMAQIDITTCDRFCAEKKISGVKLIKADIEGMGLDMLLGAEKTIRENRPVLSLCIYHNRDELFGIYRTLKSWDLNYHFSARMRMFPVAFAELTLIAWPKELGG